MAAESSATWATACWRISAAPTASSVRAPERAARAALDIVGLAAKQAVEDPRDISEAAVRVVIATGVVILGEPIGEGTSRELPAIGRAPNLAARLQSIAQPNCVVISAETRDLLHGGFECEYLGTHQLKGFAKPVPAWRLARALRPPPGTPMHIRQLRPGFRTGCSRPVLGTRLRRARPSGARFRRCRDRQVEFVRVLPRHGQRPVQSRSALRLLGSTYQHGISSCRRGDHPVGRDRPRRLRHHASAQTRSPARRLRTRWRAAAACVCAPARAALRGGLP